MKFDQAELAQFAEVLRPVVRQEIQGALAEHIETLATRSRGRRAQSWQTTWEWPRMLFAMLACAEKSPD